MRTHAAIACAALLGCAAAPEHTVVDVNVAVRRTPATITVVEPAARTPSSPTNAATVAADDPRATRDDGLLPCDTRAPVRGLATGPGHTCTVHDDGALCCWGELHGVVHTTDAVRAVDRPMRVQGIPPVRSVVLGARHTCALTDAGAVWCWGENQSGQLGDGSDRARATPSLVAGLANVDLLAAGAWHTCARVRGDGVRCWGGSMGEHVAVPVLRVPTRVEGFDDVASWALGVDTCALTAAGEMHCFGNALMYTYRRADPWRAMRRHYTLRALRDLRELALGWGEGSAGDRAACAITREGGLRCWGDGYDAGDTSRMVPAELGRLGVVHGLAMADDHGCVIRANDKVACWGANGSGQVGDGSRVTRAVPVDVALSRDVRRVAVSEGHSCALDAQGDVWCWGDNRQGQLGDGTREARTRPVAVRWSP